MSKTKYVIESISGFMLLSGIENIWNAYCIDSLSDKTKNSYYTFIKTRKKKFHCLKVILTDFKYMQF